ncbi:hypothetical protein FALBO_5464 [Fusarium albosuccineum]|uniref:Uncharacterized protein n=1 Tax=Fusarium albosuccineum TaxID=1237068 RepID=A0A8H4PFH2_9HYPO|nr:hypothetical protein FALBO_5464 [Fusarium albosuccineum]
MGIHNNHHRTASRKQKAHRELPGEPTFAHLLSPFGIVRVSHHSPLPRALHWSGTTAPNLPAYIEQFGTGTTPRPRPMASAQNLVYATAMASVERCRALLGSLYLAFGR